MSLKNRIILYGSGLLVIGILFNYISKKRQELDSQLSSVLQPHEKEKVIITHSGKNIVVSKKRIDGSIDTKIISVGSRETVITEEDNGDIRVFSPSHGFVFEPGFTVFFSDKLRMGIDVQWYYWNRWGLCSGGGVNIGGEPRTLDVYPIAICYTVPFQAFINTSFYVGYSLRNQVCIGGRLKF